MGKRAMNNTCLPAEGVGSRALLLALACLAAFVSALAMDAAPASALAIYDFKASPSSTQAGGHPDLTVIYAGESKENPYLPHICQCNDPENIDVSTPPGFIGNPHATPQCKAADFARNQCPSDSQIGVITVTIDLGGGVAIDIPNEPVYNSVPRPNQAGLFSFKVEPGFLDLAFFSELSARTGGDYGLDTRTDGIQRFYDLQKFSLTLWGVPAADVHTPLRYDGGGVFLRHSNIPSNSPLTPFLQSPVTCSGPLSASVTVTGYDRSVNSASSPWPATTGCDQLSFNPSLSAKPTTTEADSPSGVDIDLTVPQFLSPTFPSPSQIKEATVTLPAGFSINPNAADGKTSCSDAAARFGTEDAANCPEFAKVGTDTIDSVALPAPISGGIYLGDPKPGERYRIFLTADGFATHVKLPGTITPDPQTGQLVASFTNLPQSPLTEFNMHFFGAERGTLATPTKCGTYPVRSTFVPWDEALASQSSTQFFTIDSGPGGVPCPGSTRPFSPGFGASSSSNTAGAHSPFALRLTRDDGEQDLGALTAVTPPGFAATLAGIPYCSDAALAAAASSIYSGLAELAYPSCPAASQIGTAVVGAGAGSRPLHLDGKVYLAGPYKGAPLSLATITPAVSGPYDIGTVVVRAAISIDPVTAQVTTASDPVPQIVAGIPVRLRSILAKLDRPNFALNPTNCDPFEIKAEIFGSEGARASRSVPFQVANCATLDFDPKLELKLSGGMKRTGHPALRGTLTAQPGEANIARAVVTTPHSLFLDNAHINAPCTRTQYASDSCPASSVLGAARADSPLLDKPLEGPVYLRTSSHKLPDLVVDLRGQFEVELIGSVDSINEKLRVTFEDPPDVPIRTFSLSLLGGRKGLLVNSEDLCDAPQKSSVKMVGQNGTLAAAQVTIQTPCGSNSRHKRHARSEQAIRHARALR
jgi:hypothetical protein